MLVLTSQTVRGLRCVRPVILQLFTPDDSHTVGVRPALNTKFVTGVTNVMQHVTKTGCRVSRTAGSIETTGEIKTPDCSFGIYMDFDDYFIPVLTSENHAVTIGFPLENLEQF